MSSKVNYGDCALGLGSIPVAPSSPALDAHDEEKSMYLSTSSCMKEQGNQWVSLNTRFKNLFWGKQQRWCPFYREGASGLIARLPLCLWEVTYLLCPSPCLEMKILLSISQEAVNVI